MVGQGQALQVGGGSACQQLYSPRRAAFCPSPTLEVQAGTHWRPAQGLCSPPSSLTQLPEQQPCSCFPPGPHIWQVAASHHLADNYSRALGACYPAGGAGEECFMSQMASGLQVGRGRAPHLHESGQAVAAYSHARECGCCCSIGAQRFPAPSPAGLLFERDGAGAWRRRRAGAAAGASPCPSEYGRVQGLARASGPPAGAEVQAKEACNGGRFLSVQGAGRLVRTACRANLGY